MIKYKIKFNKARFNKTVIDFMIFILISVKVYFWGTVLPNLPIDFAPKQNYLPLQQNKLGAKMQVWVN